MGATVLKRLNLVLEERKVNELRRRLRARSKSEAVRIAIERELAADTGLAALRELSRRASLEDVFHRSKPNPR